MSRLITHFPQNLEAWAGWKKDWRLSKLVILTNVIWRNSVVLLYRPPKVDWFLSFLRLVLLPSFQCSVTPVILFIFCARVSQRWCQLLAAPNSDWYAGRIFHEPIDDVQTSNSVSRSVMHGAEHMCGEKWGSHAWRNSKIPTRNPWVPFYGFTFLVKSVHA